MVGLKHHWEKIFTLKSTSEVSWYKPHLEVSLQLIDRARIPKSATIIDIGGGDSALVDDLLEAGFSNLTVLDISQAALDRVRSRVRSRAETIRWLNADITQVELPLNFYDLWHDRAMFHFLIDPESQSAYIRLCQTAVRPGGTIIVATFAPDGPERCSGLPTMRYSPEELQGHFGPRFQLTETMVERHVTPLGKSQSFVYCVLKKT